MVSSVARAAPPNAPTALSAQGTASKVVLNWTAPSDDGGGAVDGYNVYRCAGSETSCDGGTDWLAWVQGADTTTYTDDGSAQALTSGSTYRYAVGASRSSELGGWSNQVVVKVVDPGAPTSFSVAAEPGYNALTWTAPAADDGGTLDGYNVYRCEEGMTACTPAWIAWVQGGGTTWYSDGNVTTGTTYRYAVAASRAAATSSWSNQDTATALAPPMPPGAPTGLNVQANPGQMALTWTAPADDGNGALDGYNVYRCEEGMTACTPTWIAWVQGGGTTWYTDSGLTTGTTYRYAVDASRGGEESGFSNEETATALALPMPPGAPTGLNVQANPGQMALTWTAPADDGNGALDGYNVYRCEEGMTACTPTWIAWVQGGGTTWYTDSGLTTRTTYRYAVDASRGGEESGFSNEETATALAPPPAPAGPVALMVDSASATTIGLIWTPPPDDGHGALDGYNVYRCDPGDSCTPEWLDWVPLSDGESFTDGNVTEDIRYRYAVASTRNNLVSAWSNQVTVVAKASTTPGAPTQLRVQDLGGSVRLNWTAPSDDGGDALDGYNVYRCEQGETACTPAWVAWAAGTSYTDSGLTPGTEYRYAVTASRNGLVSGQSNQVTVVARVPRYQLPVPPAPEALVVESASATAIGLRWTKPAYERYGAPETYHIYRCEQAEGDACSPVYIAFVSAYNRVRYTDEDVTENTRYRYAVASYRDAQFSARSNQITVVAKASTTPGAPTQLTARADGSSVALTWTAPSDDGGGTLDGYNVYRCEQGEGGACSPDWIAWVSLSDGERYTDSGLTAETQYRYAVASSRNGLISGQSNHVTETAVAAPAPAGPVALVVESASATAIGLSWTAPADDGHGALDGYNVYRCDPGDTCTPEWIAWVPFSDGERYTDEGVTEDTRYRYAVASTRSDVVSAWSNQITVVAKASTTPGAPTQLTARADGPGVALTWTAPSDDGGGTLDGYNVYRCEQGEGGACSPDWIAWVSLSDGERYTDSGLTAETQYRYAVASSRNGLVSGQSNHVTETAVAAPAPAGPEALVVESASVTAIGLSWTAPADDGHGALDGYNVYRCDPGDTCTPEWIAWVPFSDGERYTDEGVTEDTRYRYAVASTRSDVVSAWSSQITVVAKASTTPGAPTQLTARADGPGVALTWTAPSDDGGGVLDGYNVYRCEQGEGEACSPDWIAWVSLSDGERYTDSGLTAETKYRYAVAASRNGLNSGQSTPVIVTAEAAPPPLPAPRNLMVISTSFYSIQLGWTAPPEDGGGALDGYNVYRCEQGEGEACTLMWIDWVADGTGYTDSGVTAESDYRYAVASSRSGTISEWSNQVAATAEAAPAGPEALVVESASATAIGLSWTAPADDGHGALDGYNVYRCDPGDTCTPEWIAWVPFSDGERYTDEGVTEDTRYRYAVASTRSDVVSAWSSQITVVAKASTTPGAPTQLTARADGSSVALTWTAPSDDGGGVLDGYNVYRCEQGEGEACSPDWIAWVSLSDGERYTDSGLTAETQYRYAVAASRNGLNSGQSNHVTETAVAAPAPAPAGPEALVVESASATAIGLSWTAPADDGHGALDGYNVYRCDPGDTCTPEWIAWVPFSDGERYTDEGVTEDTRYRYAVASTRSDVVSAWSSQITVVAKASTTPGAPTQLTARADGPGVALTWTAPSDDGGGTLDGYNVYRCEQGEGGACSPDWIAWVSLSDGERYTDSGLTAETQYRYAVASSRNGLISGQSNHVTETAVAAPAPAGPVALVVESASATAIGLSWTAPADDGHGALDGYNVYRCDPGDTCTPEWIAWVPFSDGERYTDEGVTEDTRYRYAVASTRSDVVSAWSSQITVVAKASTTPGAPTQLTARADGPGVALTWTAPSDDGGGTLDGYNVYRCEQGEGGACSPDWIAWVSLSDGERYTDSGLTAETQYRYAVASSRNGLVSGQSNHVTETAVAAPAPAPAGPEALVVESASATAIGLSWTAPADDGHGALDGYNVYRCDPGDTCTPEWIAWVPFSDGERYTDEGVTEDTRYRYAVASTRSDVVSAWSSQITVVAKASTTPGAPTQLTARADGPGVALTWTAPSDDGGGTLDGYNVYRCEQGEGEACSPDWIAWVSLLDGERYTDSGLTAETEYRYAVAASRNGLVSGQSTPVIVTAEAALTPDAPVDLRVVHTSLYLIELGWTAPPDDGGGALDGYNVYRCEQGEGGACTPEWIDWVADGTGYTDSGVTAESEYRYTVASARKDLVSERSNQVTAVATGNVIPPAERQVMEDISVSLARSMLSSIVPTISRRFTADTGASEISLAGRNIAPGQFVEQLSSAPGHNGDPVSAHLPGNFPGSTGNSFLHHSDPWNPNAPAVGASRYAGTMGSTAGGRSGIVSGRRLLADSRFAADVGPTGQAGRTWTVWGNGDIQLFSGNSNGGGQFEGNVRTGHLGADMTVGDNHLVGVAIAHSVGEADFVTTDRSGQIGMEVTTVLPYARFLFNDRTDAWAILGAGWGERSTVIGDNLPQLVDLMPQLAAFGGRHELGSAIGGIDWTIHGDAASVRLESDDDFSVSTHRVRLGLEGSSTFVLGNAAIVRPFVELNVRVDGRTDSSAESGFELVSGALYKHAASGFWVETRGRIFVLRTEGEYEERGFSVTAGLQPRTDGTGLSLKLSPQWGAPVRNTPTFWREDALGETFGLKRGTRQQRESFRAELSYGLLAPRTDAIVTPFGELNIVSETSRRARVGTRYSHSTNSRELSLELSSDILMTTRPDAGFLETGGEFRYELWLKGNLLF